MIEVSPVLFGLVAIAAVVLLMVMGVHIAWSMMLVGFLGVIVVTGHFSSGIQLLKTTPFFIASVISFTVLPLFIFMGHLMTYGGVSSRALQTAYKWTGGLPGGLSIAVTWACVAFGAVSGSPVAATSVFTKMALPEMRKAGYDVKLACGGIAASSVIASLIPPSSLMVIYSLLAEASLAKMLMGGTLPGVLLAICLSAGILLLAARNPNLAPRIAVKPSWRERMASLPGLWPIILMALAILGGIYTGVFTPNEAASIGTVVAFAFALSCKGLTWVKMRDSLLDTTNVTCSVLIIIIGAIMFARCLAISRFNTVVASAICEMGLSPLAFVAVTMVIYIFLGFFMTASEAMALSLPIFLPIVESLGVDPIYFGVLVVASLGIGTITPPVGLVVFATKAVAGPDVTVEDVFRGVVPFFIMMVVCLVFLVAFPQIILLLPNTMGGK